MVSVPLILIRRPPLFLTRFHATLNFLTHFVSYLMDDSACTNSCCDNRVLALAERRAETFHLITLGTVTAKANATLACAVPALTIQ